MSQAGELLYRLFESVEVVQLLTRYPQKAGGSRMPVEVRVSVNPRNVQVMLQELRLDGESGDVDVRMLADTNTCHLYCWDANLGIHADVADALGLNFAECIRGDADNHSGQWKAGLEARNWRVRGDNPAYDPCIERVKRTFGHCYCESRLQEGISALQ